jgi:hypothetical protein
MNTLFLLMAKHNGNPIIPIEEVQKDYFRHLTLPRLLAKIRDGHLPIPLVNMEPSQKSAKGVHIKHLAEFLDARVEEAERDFKKLYG